MTKYWKENTKIVIIFKPVSHNTIRDKINVRMAEKHANYTKDITLGVKR